MDNPQISYHTFCLRRQILSRSEKKQIDSALYAKDAKGYRYRSYETKKQEKAFLINHPGLQVTLQQYRSNKPILCLIINPHTLLGNTSYVSIFNPSSQTIAMMEEKLNTVLRHDIGFPLTFRDFILHRVDVCCNIPLSEEFNTKSYIRLLKRAMLPLPYERISFPNSFPNADGKNAHSFRVQAPQWTFTIYDKKYQMADQDLPFSPDDWRHVLRVEVALHRSAIHRLIQEYHLVNDVHLLDELYRNSISGRQLERIVDILFVREDFCSYSEAATLLSSLPFRRNEYHLCSELLSVITRCDTLGNALQLFCEKYCVSDKKTRKLLRLFEMNGINPVTIPERDLKNRNSSFKLPALHTLIFGKRAVQAPL